MNKASWYPNDHYIEKFYKTGKFRKGTIFFRDSQNPRKWYYTCPVCSKDEYVKNGLCSGMFKADVSQLARGGLSCRCTNYTWNEKQREYQVQKALKRSETVSFVGWKTKYENSRSLMKLRCSLHGDFHLKFKDFKKGTRCKKCAKPHNLKSDKEMIESFMKKGVYPKGTLFKRSDRVTTQGSKNFWWLWCPVCKEEFEIHTSHLKVGKKPCNCAYSKQQYAYINLIKDNGIPIAIKYGITNNILTRLRFQKKGCIFDIENAGVWKFPSVASCRNCEQFIKTSVKSKLLNPREMADGWTETTSPLNIEHIILCYEDFGGVKEKTIENLI